MNMQKTHRNSITPHAGADRCFVRQYLSFSLIFGCMCGPALTAAAGTVSVPGDKTINNALTQAATGDVIQLTEDVTMTARVTITNTAAAFTIESDGTAQRVITGAANNGLITLTALTGGDIGWTFNRITLTGAGGTGSSNASALQVSGGNAASKVRIKGGDLIISSNTTSASAGAGFWVNNSYVIFETDVTFLDNTAAANHGGAVMSTTGIEFDRRVIFERNYAGQPGGTGARDGGAVYFRGTLAFNDAVSFIDNGALRNGGAVCANPNATAGLYPGMTFNNGIVARGNSAISGGAIYSPASVKIFGSGTFSGNSATQTGGAIYIGLKDATSINPGGAFNLTLSATSGDIVFKENIHGANVRNAIYYDLNFQYAQGVLFELAATGSNAIRFFDPINGNNGTTYAHAPTDVIINKSGDGSIVFDTYHTDIAATTTVNEGMFQLTNGAVYGKDGASGSFTVKAGGIVMGSGTVAAGAIVVEDGGGLGALGSGTLIFDSTNAVTIGENLILAGNGTILPGKDVTASKVLVGEDGVAGASLHIAHAVTLVNSATLSGSGLLDVTMLKLGAAGGDAVTAAIAGGGTLAVNSDVTGPALLKKTGGGQLSLNGTAFSAGGLEVSEGTLLLGATSLAAGTVSVSGGALNITSGTLAAGAVTLSGSGQLGFVAGSGAITAASFEATDGSINILGGLSGLTDLVTSQTEITPASLAAVNLLSNGNQLGNIDDYRVLELQLASGNKIIQLTSALAWNESLKAHGTFKVAAGRDIITEELEDRTPTTVMGDWDGKSLTKTGSGTLILAANNTYSGTTLISEGVLQMGDGSASGGIAAGSEVVNHAALAFNRPDSIQFSNTISGSGVVIQGGTGELELTGANSHTGGVRVDSGTLVINAIAPLGSGTLALNGGAVRTGGESLALGAIESTGGGIFDGGGITASLSGTGALEKRGDATLTVQDAMGFSGATTISKGTLRLNSNATLDAVILANDASAKLDMSGQTVIVRALSGGGAAGGNVSLGSSGTLVVDLADDSVFAGVISGGATGGLEKTGTGSLTLTKAQAYGGFTTIRGGALAVGIANALTVGSGLVLETGGVFDLRGYSQQIKSLGGTGGLIVMSTNLSDGLGDLLDITGNAAGDHQVLVNNSGGSMPNHTQLLIKTVGGDADFTLAQPVFAGMHEYSLVRGGDPLVAAGNPDFWYLANTWRGSPSGQAILYTAGSLGTEWHYSLDSVRKRMGDIRQSKEAIKKDPTGSLWARGNAYHLEADADLIGLGFEEDVYEMSVGIDKAFVGERNLLLLGAMISLSYMDRDFRAQGSGESTAVGFGLYGTWLHDAGWYADLTVKTDRYDNSIDALAGDGGTTSANYVSDVHGVSLEFGREFKITRKWWVEPAVQAAIGWLQSADYSTDTSFTQDPSLDVHIGGARVLQYRIEVRTGLKELGRWLPYARIGGVCSDTFGGDVCADEITYTPWFDGWRLEAGAGMGIAIDEGGMLFVDYEYVKADRYERPWSFTIGYRRAW